MFYQKNKEIHHELKVGYALTSFQECPSCKQHINKNELNLIDETITKFPVVNQIIKKYYHLRCFSENQLQKAVNKFSPLETVSGYELLSEEDQMNFRNRISSLLLKIKTKLAHEEESLTYVSQSQNIDKSNRHFNTKTLQFCTKSNQIDSRIPSQAPARDEKTSFGIGNIGNKLNESPMCSKYSDTTHEKKQQTLSFGKSPEEIKHDNNIQILQQQMKQFRFDGKGNKKIVKQANLALNIRDLEFSSSSDEQPKKAQTIKYSKPNQEKPQKELTLVDAKVQKFISTSEKLDQIMKLKESQKERATNLYDPKKIKKRKIESDIDQEKSDQYGRGIEESSYKNDFIEQQVENQQPKNKMEVETNVKNIIQNHQFLNQKIGSEQSCAETNLKTSKQETVYHIINNHSNELKGSHDKTTRLNLIQKVPKLSNDTQFHNTPRYNQPDQEPKAHYQYVSGISNTSSNQESNITKNTQSSNSKQQVEIDNQQKSNNQTDQYENLKNIKSTPNEKERQLRQAEISDKKQLVQLLENNGYLKVKNLSQQWLVCLVKDGIMNGAIPHCPACNDGQLIHNKIKGEYFCTGSTDNICTSTFNSSEIKRNKWVQLI